MKAIRSLKAFNAALAELAAGEVDSFGGSDHKETECALRVFAGKQSGRFSELMAYINEAAEAGFNARTNNRVRLVRELEIERACAANNRPW